MFSEQKVSLRDLRQEKTKSEDNKENYFGSEKTTNKISKTKSQNFIHLYLKNSSSDESDTRFEKPIYSLDLSLDSSDTLSKICVKNKNKNSFRSFGSSSSTENKEETESDFPKKRKKENESFESTSAPKKNKTGSPLNTQKLSFEELLEKMLSPPMDDPRKRKNDNERFGSIFSAPKKNQTESCLLTQKTSFEELLNKMLSPPMDDPRQEKNDNECFGSISALQKQNETESCVLTQKLNFEDVLEKMLSPPMDHPREQKNEHINCSETQIFSDLTVTRDDNDNLSFGEILEKMLTPISTIKERQKINECKKRKELTQRDSNLEISMLPLDSEQTEIFEPSFEKTLDDIAPPLDKNQKTTISTQTSFEIFTPMSMTQNSVAYPQLPYFPSQRFTNSQVTETSIVNENREDNSVVVSQTLNSQTDNTDISNQRANLLEILSHDITVTTDGFKIFNNLAKVGTVKWLETALSTVGKSVINKTWKNEVAIMEHQNGYDLYVDKTVKTALECFTKEDTKICKIIKNGVVPKIDLSYISKQDNKKKCSVRQLKQSIDTICANEDLLSGCETIQVIDKKKIQSKIYDILSKIYEVFENNKMPCLVVRRSYKASLCVYENERLQCASSDAGKLRKIHFPGKLCCRRFCRLVYMLGKVYNLLENNQKLTKREIYYQIKHLVTNQEQVNRVVGDISQLVGVGPWDLNIISHSGLVYGNLRLFWASGEMTNCNTPATLIPYDLDEIIEIHSTANFILVVEKESIFHKLLEEDLPNKLARPFIMITGKGVPDINTRLFLKKLSTMLKLPVFVLVDPDLYGIRIMLNYRFGTITNCHLSEQLAVPNARWLGVFPSEIAKFGIQFQNITQREVKAINETLKYPYMEAHPKIADELNYLLHSGKKGSIEGLVKNNTFLSEAYLPVKLFNQDFI
nr:PREDICTED: uncharacterized protein LOC100142154 isoform X2 [Tribolium castaneum]|eukprot:XP_015836079.1 PREDICTED: uncharacterized protein LOC100142154 isoform X2 [Tribolium castaneum]